MPCHDFDAITWNVDPEIFHIGQLSIRWYGLMFASAFLSGYIVFTRYLATERLTSEMMDQLLIYIAVGYGDWGPSGTLFLL